MPPPTFRVRVDGRFWQLWARTITGTNLTHHCMRALTGTNTPGLGRATPPGEWHHRQFPELPDAIAYYICGVSPANILTKNAHLLLLPETGSTARLRWGWGQVEVSGARAIPITPDFIDPAHPRAVDKVYRTCRNWQAAWMLNEWFEGPAPRLF